MRNLKMVSIDKQIKNALHQCLGNNNIRQAKIAREAGIQQASISRWISGLTLNMGDHNWLKILPYIEKYLPEGYEPKDTRGNKKIFTINQNYKNINVNSHNGNHNNTKDLEKDHFEVILLKYFREIKSEAEKIKLLGIVQEKAENQNQ
jgi:transcriptional regulator with XRE-family HTH domain